MSAIDQYKHSLLGFLECPSEDELVFNSSTRRIAIYRLEEQIPSDETDFDGKSGDILIGGGSGEALALRVAIPEIFNYLLDEKWDAFTKRKQVYQAFWTPTFAYKVGNGCRKLGWNSQAVDLKTWLVEHLVAFLLEHYSEKYLIHQLHKEGSRFDGKIYKRENEWT